ncbi:MAG TPA: pseudouridine synthase [Actinomycetaceae bacterium]|nr:pseudouridine synthase [Actinomycetaceae bacterium]
MSPVHDPTGERLQKVLAAAGLGSRRACERLITEGRVSVDGVVVTELGLRVSDTAVVHVDGVRVRLDPEALTIALHKPAGVVSTMADPQGRPSLADYVESRSQRLFHVGRLDEATEGLILLTNDGELAHRLTHPSYEVPKTYVATVSGTVSAGTVRRLRDGVELDDGPAAADRVRVLGSRAGESIVELVLHEGRNRIVRRLLGAVGHPVHRLVRTGFATLSLGQLPPGHTRRVGGRELATLMASVGL